MFICFKVNVNLEKLDIIVCSGVYSYLVPWVLEAPTSRARVWMGHSWVFRTRRTASSWIWSKMYSRSCESNFSGKCSIFTALTLLAVKMCFFFFLYIFYNKFFFILHLYLARRTRALYNLWKMPEDDLLYKCRFFLGKIFS